ncbi:DMT family transporter [Rhodovulum euryhalinum]|uniref:Drug/metabolite transporter (DMT)-like permease n=1 Tax=Rhodovulum euryhalinum TaxID=35805 RepID=A0A4R2KCD7_9RHOB|nr:DMT family transporter [Rhodovulum euryhalinum]TCO69922.1 drug/metabolite transporter (DMT)-like permease [Rhodovulum euryhalinum]
MNPARAIALKLASVALFVAMSALIKAAADHVPPGEAVFFRSFFAIPVIVAWLAWQGALARGLRTKNPLGHLWRGLVGGTAMGLMFAGLGLLPLPEVTAIGYAAPLLVVIFAAMFLGEEVRMFRLAAVALGLAGVLIVLSPRLTAFGSDAMEARETLGAVVTLAGAACAALAQVFVRKLVQTESTSSIVFWFSVNASVLSLLTIPFGWVVPGPAEAAMLVGAGLLGGLAQICMTSAYRHAEAAVVAPFDYASMLLALGVGYVVFDEVPTPVMLWGASLVILAGVLIIWRERQLGLERSRARKGMTPQG